MDKPTFTEGDIVNALLNAADFRTNSEPRKITIERAGFSFEIQAVNEDNVARAQKLSTKNRGRRNEETDWQRYAAHLIYFATVDDDKARIWDNRDVWQALNAVNGADVIYKCLTPAERAEIVSIIEKISGYDDGNVSVDDFIQKK